MVDKPAAESVSLDHIRYTSGASLSPDATAFACLVDDGGYPRAVQRFLEGRRTTSARSVELPVDGPITRVIHSADGHWLACQVSPHGGNRPQVWVVTTDPDDRAARMLGTGDDCAVELIGWDGTLVAVTGTDEEGVSEARLVNPHTQAALVLDRRVGGRLVDAWRGDAGDGSSLLRVGPRGNRELLLLRGDAKTPLLPADPGSSSEVGIILDDHYERGPGNPYRDSGMFGARAHGDRILVKSDYGCEFARLLEVVSSPDGTSYRVLAERVDCELDEFIVSDDTSTVALLWNVKGYSELQILHVEDGSLDPPIDLPGLLASELSISAVGSEHQRDVGVGRRRSPSRWQVDRRGVENSRSSPRTTSSMPCAASSTTTARLYAGDAVVAAQHEVVDLASTGSAEPVVEATMVPAARSRSAGRRPPRSRSAVPSPSGGGTCPDTRPGGGPCGAARPRGSPARVQ